MPMMEELGDKGVLMDTQNPEQTIQNIRQPVNHYDRGAGGMHDQYGSGLYDMQGRLLSTAQLSGLYITGGEKVGIK